VLSLVGGLVYGVSQLAEPASQWVRSMPQDLTQLESRLRELLEPMHQVEAAAERVERITRSDGAAEQEVRLDDGSLRERVLSSMKGLVGGGALMFVLLYFLLASGDLFTRKLIRVMPTFGDKRVALTVARQIQVEISRHLLTITIINAVLGVAVAMSMRVLGMPNPVLWGVMATLLNYVPYLGALTGVAVLCLAALGQFDELGRALLVPSVYLALTALEGSFVTPTVLGQRLRLNPVAIFVGLLFWGWLWGVPGAMLAVPILVAFKIVCDHYEPLAPVAEFLGP
jgi:predicted PurR-regulated permease PerM